MPTTVADKLVRRFAVQRYAGSVEVVAARADDGRTDPRAIRYGDTITIPDWANNESQVLRVMEVAQGPDAVTIGVEQPVNIAALLAHTSAGQAQARRPRQARRRETGLTGRRTLDRQGRMTA